MAKKLRVGVLGAGMAGEGHATAFSRLPDVEVTALWSRTRARAEGLADKRMRLVLTSAHRTLHNRMHQQGYYHGHTPVTNHSEHQ